MEDHEKIRQFNVQVPARLWSALSFWATYTGRTKREIVIEALKMYLEMHGVNEFVRFLDEED